MRVLADTLAPGFCPSVHGSLGLPSLPMRHTSLWSIEGVFIAISCTERVPGRDEEFPVAVLSRERASRYCTNGSLPHSFVDQLPEVAHHVRLGRCRRLVVRRLTRAAG
jgi:hypothetical protein